MNEYFEESNTRISIDNLYQIYLKHPSVCTDTRKIQKGDLFFALKGEHFNGNQFAVQALENGAAYAIVDEELSNSGINGTHHSGQGCSGYSAEPCRHIIVINSVFRLSP